MAIKISYGPPRTMLQHVVENVTSSRHWVTADGRRIAIGKMEDNHLINTVRKLRRAAVAMQAEEPGQTDCDAVNVVGQEDYLLQRVKPYAAMMRELEKRKLDKAARSLRPLRLKPRRDDMLHRVMARPNCWDMPDLWGTDDEGWRR